MVLMPKGNAVENNDVVASGQGKHRISVAAASPNQSKAEKQVSRRGLDTPKWDYVREVVRRMAYRIFGRSYGDAVECAAEFTCSHWKEPRLEQWPFSGLTDVWLKVVASHYVHNFERRIKRMRKHEIEADELAEAVMYMVRSPVPGPEQLVALSQ